MLSTIWSHTLEMFNSTFEIKEWKEEQKGGNGMRMKKEVKEEHEIGSMRVQCCIRIDWGFGITIWVGYLIIEAAWVGFRERIRVSQCITVFYRERESKQLMY